MTTHRSDLCRRTQLRISQTACANINPAGARNASGRRCAAALRVADMGSVFAWFFLSLNGRISRQEFWLGYVGLSAVLFALIRRLQGMALHGPGSRMWSRHELDLALALPKFIAFLILVWPL